MYELEKCELFLKRVSYYRNGSYNYVHICPYVHPLPHMLNCSARSVWILPLCLAVCSCVLATSSNARTLVRIAHHTFKRRRLTTTVGRKYSASPHLGLQTRSMWRASLRCSGIRKQWGYKLSVACSYGVIVILSNAVWFKLLWLAEAKYRNNGNGKNKK